MVVDKTEVQNQKNFTQTLKYTPRIKDSKRKIRGKQARVWVGIGLKPKKERGYGDDNEESGTDGTAGTHCTTQSISKYNNNIEQEPNSVPHVLYVPVSDTVINENNVDSVDIVYHEPGEEKGIFSTLPVTFPFFL